MADLRGKNLDETRQDVITKGAGGTFEDGHGVAYFDPADKAPLSVKDSGLNGTYTKIYTSSNAGLIIQTHRVEFTFDASTRLTATWTFPQEFDSMAYSIGGMVSFFDDAGSSDFVLTNVGSTALTGPIEDPASSRSTSSIPLRIQRASSDDFVSGDKLHALMTSIGTFNDS